MDQAEKYALEDHVLSDAVIDNANIPWWRMDATILSWLYNTIAIDLLEVCSELLLEDITMKNRPGTTALSATTTSSSCSRARLHRPHPTVVAVACNLLSPLALVAAAVARERERARASATTTRPSLPKPLLALGPLSTTHGWVTFICGPFTSSRSSTVALVLNSSSNWALPGSPDSSPVASMGPAALSGGSSPQAAFLGDILHSLVQGSMREAIRSTLTKQLPPFNLFNFIRWMS
ncbi:hypothetical protein ACP70R_029090 [Stipagrostis hirtigluma subsp. patula]